MKVLETTPTEITINNSELTNDFPILISHFTEDLMWFYLPESRQVFLKNNGSEPVKWAYVGRKYTASDTTSVFFATPIRGEPIMTLDGLSEGYFSLDSSFSSDFNVITNNEFVLLDAINIIIPTTPNLTMCGFNMINHALEDTNTIRMSACDITYIRSK